MSISYWRCRHSRALHRPRAPRTRCDWNLPLGLGSDPPKLAKGHSPTGGNFPILPHLRRKRRRNRSRVHFRRRPNDGEDFRLSGSSFLLRRHRRMLPCNGDDGRTVAENSGCQYDWGFPLRAGCCETDEFAASSLETDIKLQYHIDSFDIGA